MGKGSEWTRYMSSFLSFLVFHLFLSYLPPPFAPPAATGSHRQLVADDGRLAPFSHARADQLCLTAARKCSCDIGCPRTRVRRRRVRAAEPAAAALSTVAVDGRLAPFSHARADQLCLTAARKCSCDIGCPRTRVRRRRVRAAEPAAAALSTVAVDGRLTPFSHARADLRHVHFLSAERPRSDCRPLC